MWTFDVAVDVDVAAVEVIASWWGDVVAQNLMGGSSLSLPA